MEYDYLPSFLLGIIEGRPGEVQENPTINFHETIERRKSIRVPEKKLSIPISVKRKGRLLNKVF